MRDIEPYKEMWHLPGGTVHFNERLVDAVKTRSHERARIKVTGSKFIDYIEYPTHIEHSFDTPLGMAFLVDYLGDIKTDEQASEANGSRASV